MGLLEIPGTNRPTEEEAFADLMVSDTCLIEETVQKQIDKRLSPRQREILERHVFNGEQLKDLEVEMGLSEGRGQSIFNLAKNKLKQSTELRGLRKLLP